MATITKRPLSGSSGGKMILIASTTAGSGTLIHTAVSGATASGSKDEVWIYAQNLTSGTKRITVNYWALTSGHKITCDLPVKQFGPQVVVPGYILFNSNVVRIYATAANSAAVVGYVNRIA